MKILHVVGARPQFIKYIPIAREIKKYNQSESLYIQNILVHTGQHYDYEMSEIFFKESKIDKPDYNIVVGSHSHGKQTSIILENTEKILLEERPDSMFVYGDTNSTVAASLAAAKIDIPVFHIESGLRSFNKNMPEEINRIVTDHVSTVLFTPSKTAVNNLQKEGFNNILNKGYLIEDIAKFGEKIILNKNNPLVLNIGDIMYDTVILSSKIAKKHSKILEELSLSSDSYYLLTIHRAENTDNIQKFNEILNFINKITTGKKVIFPMHPRTESIYKQNQTNKFNKNINIIKPVGYFDILELMDNSSLLLTDSGGMQKEAFWLDTPCITLREQTEWIETIDNRRNILYEDFKSFEYFKDDYNKNAYGTGNTGKKIIQILNEIVNNEK